jgi:hypothetical protein
MSASAQICIQTIVRPVEVLVGPALAEMIFTTRAGVSSERGLRMTVGEYKLFMQSSGQRSRACLACGVTSAVQCVKETSTDKAGGGQQDAHAGSTES